MCKAQGVETCEDALGAPQLLVLEWVGGRWVVQLHRTNHGALDACFVAQHTASENVQWKDWQIWEMFT